MIENNKLAGQSGDFVIKSAGEPLLLAQFHMSYRFEVELTPENDWGVRLAYIRIDDRPLIDLVREVEIPIATAADQPKLAGTYDYLPAPLVLHPSRRFMRMDVPGGKVAVLGCECGLERCCPLLMRITFTNDSVIWSELQQPHWDTWIYPPDWRLVFERGRYERALALPA